MALPLLVLKKAFSGAKVNSGGKTNAQQTAAGQAAAHIFEKWHNFEPLCRK